MHTLVSTLESRLLDWLALQPRPRYLLSPNPMPKWNAGGARHRMIPSQYMLLVLKSAQQSGYVVKSFVAAIIFKFYIKLEIKPKANRKSHKSAKF